MRKRISFVVALAASLWAIVPTATAQIAYIPTFSENTVAVYNAGTNSIVTTITGFDLPLGVAVKPDGSEAYIVESYGNVRVINTATNSIVATIPVGNPSLNSAVFSPSGSRAYISGHSCPR